MATDRTVIDASALASINYDTYFAEFFEGLAAATRKYYGGAGTNGSQVGFSFGTAVDDPYVLMTGANVGYDMNTHTYAGSIDTINFGSVGPGTDTTGTLVTGVEQGLLISNLGVSVAPGGGMGVDPDAAGFNEVYAYLSALRDAGLAEKHDAYVELLYKLFSSKAQDFTGTAGNDTYTGTAFDDLIKGGAGDDILNGGDGNDEIDGGAGNDEINGGKGDDVIRGGGGNDEIDGGDGLDTVIFDGNFTDFTVTGIGTANITVSNGTWTSTLTNVEALSFGSVQIYNNWNFAPTDLSLSKASVDENSASGVVVGALSASDLNNDALTYTLKDDAGGKFALQKVGNVSQLVVNGALNYEAAKNHTVVVEVSDGTNKVEKTFTINVSDVNEGPSATALSKNTVAENTKIGTVVATLTATDPENHAIAYSLASGSSSAFKIDGNKLVVNGALDYEKVKSHTVKLVATDAHGLKSETTLNIGVNNVNEGPSATTLSKTSFAENVKVGTVVATLKATDVDAGDTLKYSLGSGSSSAFKIDGNKLVVNKALDYETLQSHSLKLVATDKGGLSSTTTVKIGVTDVLETIKGTNKAETLKGGIGADKIDGYAGNDVISGGAGNDKIWGGLGADKLTGGAGADTFVFKAKAESTLSASDAIYDFSGKQGDRIDLSGFDANDTKSGIQDFSFIGTKAFSGKAGELRFEAKASDSYIYADTNGDKKADFALHFDDKISFVKGDFLF